MDVTKNNLLSQVALLGIFFPRAHPFFPFLSRQVVKYCFYGSWVAAKLWFHRLSSFKFVAASVSYSFFFSFLFLSLPILHLSWILIPPWIKNSCGIGETSLTEFRQQMRSSESLAHLSLQHFLNGLVLCSWCLFKIERMCDRRTGGKKDGQTDRRTNGRTDGRTHPFIEMRERIL